MARGENSFHVCRWVDGRKESRQEGELDNHLFDAVPGTALRYSHVLFQFFLQQLGGQIVLFLFYRWEDWAPGNPLIQGLVVNTWVLGFESHSFDPKHPFLTTTIYWSHVK